MTIITIHTSSVSDDGRLMHAEDATAQACLAVLRLEDALARRTLGGRRIVGLEVRMRTADAAAIADVVGVVRERLGGVEVPLRVSPVARLEPAGAIVELWAEVDAEDRTQPKENPTCATSPAPSSPEHSSWPRP